MIFVFCHSHVRKSFSSSRPMYLVYVHAVTSPLCFRHVICGCKRGRAVQICQMCLTRLLDQIQDGLATRVLVVLKTLHTVVLVFVRAIDSVFIVDSCIQKTTNQKNRQGGYVKKLNFMQHFFVVSSGDYSCGLQRASKPGQVLLL